MCVYIKLDTLRTAREDEMEIKWGKIVPEILIGNLHCTCNKVIPPIHAIVAPYLLKGCMHLLVLLSPQATAYPSNGIGGEVRSSL